jgi:hypothetical protein
MRKRWQRSNYFAVFLAAGLATFLTTFFVVLQTLQGFGHTHFTTGLRTVFLAGAAFFSIFPPLLLF